MNEDCKYCNQTPENCECHIDKNIGLYNLIKEILKPKEDD